MPCTPGMTGCKADCGHRRFVQDYRAARDEQAIRAETHTKGYEAEMAEYFGASGRPIESRVLFREWLRERSGADYPYPSRWGMTLTLAQDLELSEWAYTEGVRVA